MTQADLSRNFFVEISVAAVVMLVFTALAAITIKERHRDAAAWHVILSAAIYGAIFGAVIGFVVVPLRALLIDGSLPPQAAAAGGFTTIAIMIALRSGLIMRLPFLGSQVKAWRRAALRRAVEKANLQLEKLAPVKGQD